MEDEMELRLYHEVFKLKMIKIYISGNVFEMFEFNTEYGKIEIYRNHIHGLVVQKQVIHILAETTFVLLRALAFYLCYYDYLFNARDILFLLIFFRFHLGDIRY